MRTQLHNIQYSTYCLMVYSIAAASSAHVALNKLSLLSRLSLKISSYVFETPQRKRMPLRGILFLVESARVLETVS